MHWIELIPKLLKSSHRKKKGKKRSGRKKYEEKGAMFQILEPRK